ncbi:MAG: M23 family metallopeptidase [Geobacter sp.]|nr:M23 family metallopeptidase [Geobacter sp.]
MKKSILIILLLIGALTAESHADLTLPVDGTITSGVGWRLDPFGSGKFAFHRGIDIATPTGTPVRATRNGRVVHAGNRSGYGITVIIQHDNSDRTLYGHNSSLAVKQGEQVVAGAIIAYSGNTGRSTGPHVHYELLPGGKSTGDGMLVKAIREPKPLAGANMRRSEEKVLDDAVGSIMEKIRGGGVLAGGVGQGG